MKFLSALGYKNYRIFISGQALANIGNMVHQVAVSWLAYQLTESVFILGVVTFSNQLAAFFSGLLAGVVADRFNKKLIIQISHALIGVSSLLLALVTYLDLSTVLLLIVFQLVMGFMKGVEMPTRQAFVNDLIPDKAKLTNAIALNSTVFNTARVVGPAIAGIIIPIAGEEFCFLVYGVMSLAILIAFFFVHTDPFQAKSTKLNFRSEFLEGANYAFGTPPIKVSLLFVFAFTLVGVSFIVLLPPLTGEVFNAGSEVFGYMNSALGLGAIIGGVFLASRVGTHGIQKFIFGAAVIFSISLLTVSFSKLLTITLIAIAFTGLGRVVVFAGTNTLLQTISADDKRGRVLSFYIAAFMSAVTLGGMLVGALADIVGLIPTLLIEGVLCMVVCLAYASQLKVVSNAGKVALEGQ